MPSPARALKCRNSKPDTTHAVTSEAAGDVCAAVAAAKIAAAADEPHAAVILLAWHLLKSWPGIGNYIGRYE